MAQTFTKELGQSIETLQKMQQELAALRTKTAPEFIDFESFKEPAFITSERLLIANLELLQKIAEASWTTILMAQKAYALYETYPLIRKYLAGAVASGPYEARLAAEAMPDAEVQVFSPAYSGEDLEETLPYVTKLIVNRLRQAHEVLPWLERERERRKAAGDPRPLELGLRLNPEYSEVETDLYNPAAPGSRLGTTRRLFDQDLAELAREKGMKPNDPSLWAMIDGVHVHSLCEDNFQPMIGVIENIERKFDFLLRHVRWANLGGGHHLTREDYELDKMVCALRLFKMRWDLEDLYLEPGEAVVYDTGWLLTRILDFVPNEVNNAILTVSATCHTPDVLEMPYRPRCFAIRGGAPYTLAEEANVLPYTYRFAGPSCLAGDTFGDYSFETPLQRGDRIVFCDMTLYTHVKTTMFNGMKHPDLVLLKEDGTQELLKRYTFKDFYTRFGELDPKTYGGTGAD